MTGFARLRIPALVVSLLTVFFVLVGAGTASAHADFVSSDPADGAILSTPPAQMTLTFSEDLLAGANTVSITDKTGAVIVSEAVEPQGASVVVPWPAAADGGTYQVAYRVVSADGHPITGSVTITVGRSSPEPMPSSSEAPEPESGLVANVFVVAVVGVVIVLIAAVIIVMVRRRSL
jgi:methionine-rich copper-binding protein CopC